MTLFGHRLLPEGIKLQAPNPVKSRVRAEQAAQWVNCLSYWHEDLNLKAQHKCKNQTKPNQQNLGMAPCIFDPKVLGEGDGRKAETGEFLELVQQPV